MLRSYSKTQGNVALSSAEAELYPMVSATSEGLAALAMALDFGKKVGVVLHVDASAAIGVAQRNRARPHQVSGYPGPLDTGCGPGPNS